MFDWRREGSVPANVTFSSKRIIWTLWPNAASSERTSVFQVLWWGSHIVTIRSVWGDSAGADTIVAAVASAAMWLLEFSVAHLSSNTVAGEPGFRPSPRYSVCLLDLASTSDLRMNMLRTRDTGSVTDCLAPALTGRHPQNITDHYRCSQTRWQGGKYTRCVQTRFMISPNLPPCQPPWLRAGREFVVHLVIVFFFLWRAHLLLFLLFLSEAAWHPQCPTTL